VEILPGHQFRPPYQKNPFSYKWNPGVIQSLDAFRPDVVVLSGYVHPTMHLAARWCIRHGVAYGIASETSARSSTTSGLKWQLKRRVAGWIVQGMSFGLPVGREAGDYLRSLGSSSTPMYYFPNTPDTIKIAGVAESVLGGATDMQLRQRLGIPA